MTNSELVDYFVGKLLRSEITFDKVRPELEQRGIAENDITIIVRQVDDELQTRLLSTSRSYSQLAVFGIALTLVGIIITIASYAGWFSIARGYIVIIAYGPILTGIAMIFAGLRRRKPKQEQKFGSRMREKPKD